MPSKYKSGVAVALQKTSYSKFCLSVSVEMSSTPYFRKDIATKCSENLPVEVAQRILSSAQATAYQKQRHQDALVMAHIMHPVRGHDQVICNDVVLPPYFSTLTQSFPPTSYLSKWSLLFAVL